MKKAIFINRTALEFIISLCILCAVSIGFSEFLSSHVELREQTWGIFPDPFFLNKPIALSTPIFLIMYGSIVFFIYYHIKLPEKLISLIQAAIVLLVLRAIILFIFRLDEPSNMIDLRDPIMETFIYSKNPITGC